MALPSCAISIALPKRASPCSPARLAAMTVDLFLDPGKRVLLLAAARNHLAEPAANARLIPVSCWYYNTVIIKLRTKPLIINSFLAKNQIGRVEQAFDFKRVSGLRITGSSRGVPCFACGRMPA